VQQLHDTSDMLRDDQQQHNVLIAATAMPASTVLPLYVPLPAGIRAASQQAARHRLCSQYGLLVSLACSLSSGMLSAMVFQRIVLLAHFVLADSLNASSC
jgi:hypothetical protein